MTDHEFTPIGPSLPPRYPVPMALMDTGMILLDMWALPNCVCRQPCENMQPVKQDWLPALNRVVNRVVGSIYSPTRPPSWESPTLGFKANGLRLVEPQPRRNLCVDCSQSHCACSRWTRARTTLLVRGTSRAWKRNGSSRPLGRFNSRQIEARGRHTLATPK